MILLSLHALKNELTIMANPAKAKILAGFFKTGKGEYGEGDTFLGITVPQSREVAIKYKHLPLPDVKRLLQSKIHEERLIALMILAHNYTKGYVREKKEIFDFYLANTKYINNWDLVDLSADKIVGAYLLDKPRVILYKLAKSQNIWDRRIAIIATYRFIKDRKEYKDTFAIAQILLPDKHDLIHKAVGWMLREVGKHIGQEIEESFLRKHYRQMPRTMLRYAIEHFPLSQRIKYLQGRV